MNKNLLFDFTVDKAAKTVLITREFAADQSLVWDAFTKAELLDQWTAPAPWTARTKHMDFKVGGRRFYAMVSPEGQERWAIQTYTSISPKTNFKMFNTFADADENPELPGSNWDYTFSEQDGITKVCITIFNESLARMEKMIEMGFIEGFKASVHNLENLLATFSQKGENGNIQAQTAAYIASQPEPKRDDLQALHRFILGIMPGCKLWFLDGKNSEGKVVSNPNIGYGLYTIKYADGTTRDFYQIGLSANTSGISVYVMGLEDKTYLAKTYGDTIGKASVTGYCIKFKTVKDINLVMLEAAIRFGVEATKA